jgi:ADP-ribose pyrophosphatase YjhB (NUDIX family)
MDNGGQGPRLCVEVVIKTEEGTLLVQNSDKWVIPGGAVMHGEVLTDAVKRIARQEGGVEVETVKVMGYIEYAEKDNVRGLGWSVGIAFEAKITGGELKGQIFKNLPGEMIWEQKEFLTKK